MPNRRRRRPAIEQRPGREELAFLLPFFGTLLLLPPLVDLFVGKRLVLFGLPLESLYLFGVWLLMIVGAKALTWCRPFRDSLAAGDDLPFDDSEHARAEAGAEAGGGPDTGSSIGTGLAPGPGTGSDSGRSDGVD